MSVRDEATAAAYAAYPSVDVVALVNDEGETLGAIVAGNVTNAMARTPYAQGYQAGHERGYLAGHAAALRSIAEFGRQRQMRPEIDQPGCCETCRGSGRVATGPWGSRPPKKVCDDCDGSGWSQ